MKKLLYNISAATVAAFTLFGCSAVQNEVSYVDYVDTAIGTGGHGHVFAFGGHDLRTLNHLND